MTIWATLGIPRGSDRAAIRRAYATRLRVTNPEDDPEGFKRLRAAYDAALRHLDHAAAWAAADEDDGTISDTESDWREPPNAATGDPHGQAPPEEPEIAAAMAAREAEIDALRAAMADLEAGLRGPWRPTDAVLEERLNAILRAPALGEIRIRTDNEPWLAALLASTIPHSDAVLLQSIQAFGWGKADRWRSVDPAITMVLDRLDEWRLIESLNRPGHAHHAAWRSLTRAPGPWWSWRIQAFRPGMIGGIEIFLGIRGEVAPGLHYSYKKESVERWRRFLAKPRMTLGILALMPLVFLAQLWLGSIMYGSGVAPSSAVIAGAAVIGFATPFAALHLLARWRQRFQERAGRARWLTEGWLAAFVLLAFATMALPPPYWPTFIVLPAIGIAIWSYIVVPPAEPGSLNLGGAAIFCAGGLGLMLVFAHFDPAELFALAVIACLLAYLRLALLSAVRVTLGRLLGQHREWFILGGTAAGLALALAALQLRAAWHPAPPVYLFALAAAGLLPLVGALPGGVEGPSRVIARAALLFAFLASLGASVPPDRAADPATSPVVRALSDDARADMAMAALERRQPGFAQLRGGNPALYADIRDVLKRVATGGTRRDEADREIASLIDHAYAAMLPRADTTLLIEGLRIRLERLQSLRTTAPAVCASGDSGGNEPAMSEELSARKRREIFGVVSSPPEAHPVGRIISGAEVAARAAAAEHVDLATLLNRLEGHKGVDVACAARIAVTQALLDSDSQDDIAATLRDQYRRKRPARPAPRGVENRANRQV
ncbi:hypothetical protein GCM10009087_04710 [Sphingomonas oligophenolica]|uniref:J domain-containing protein n=1 Tax=Sphingomonas oligophenolica TaxID=301154 RepID=A0ABU9Y5Z8_9SPHN